MASENQTNFAISAAIYKGAKGPALKTAERGAEWVTVKQPEKRPKHPKNSQNVCFSGFSAVFRLFFGCSNR